MTTLDIVLSLFFGSLIGFIIGLTSIGAGALVLPTLTLVFGMPASIAIGTATLYAFLTKIFASWRHWQLKTVNLRVALVFLAGAAPANALAAWLISKKAAALREQAEALHVFQGRLTILIAVVIAICALSLVRTGFKARPPMQEAGGIFPNRQALRNAATILAGLVVGLIMGASGIGGGVMVVPVLILLLGLPPRQTVGTSIFIALFLSFLTAIIYGKSGQSDVAIAIVMSVGAWVGVYWGGKLVTRLPERQLVVTVAATVMVAAMIMIVKALSS
jgi:uncharacterized membrane protein YfcA